MARLQLAGIQPQHSRGAVLPGAPRRKICGLSLFGLGKGEECAAKQQRDQKDTFHSYKVQKMMKVFNAEKYKTIFREEGYCGDIAVKLPCNCGETPIY